MVKFTPFRISAVEARLIDAIQEVRYGELFGVEVPDEAPSIDRELHPATKDLILTIRTGCQYIDVLTIQNGQPTLAEMDYIINGFRCRQKVRFPRGAADPTE